MPSDLSMQHPGTIILEEFLEPKGISVFRLARDIDLSTRRIYEIVQGQRPITADIAHRLAHYFGMSERYWLDLQARFDAKRGDRLFTDKRSSRYDTRGEQGGSRDANRLYAETVESHARGDRRRVEH